MDDPPENTDALIDKLVERSVEQAVFGDRPDFLKLALQRRDHARLPTVNAGLSGAARVDAQ